MSTYRPEPDESSPPPASRVDGAHPAFKSNGLIADRLAAEQTRPGRGPLTLLVDFFSSIWLGVILLTLLFIYSAVGSSGVPTHLNILDPAVWLSVRQMRPFEMTEFEWFHWWPFDLLIALICLNIIVATVRRVPFNLLNLGVWMIHGGVIILAAGSVWYFGTKVEGMSLVNRRRIHIEAPGIEPTSMLAVPGNTKTIGSGANGYVLRVASIDPHWELLSGEEKGKRAYKVSVMVQSQAGMFIRDLIANRPDYTQDIIRTDDPNQPMQRAVKVLGKPLVDEALKLRLDYDPQEYFYLANSRALYLRAVGQTEWVQRPIEGLPRYNDYIADITDASSPEPLPQPRPLQVSVPPVDPNDPLPDVTFNISRFLRYASLRDERLPSPDGPLEPAVAITIRTDSGPSRQYQLIALDPSNNSILEGNLQFWWINSAAALERMKQRVNPVISFSIPSANVQLDEQIKTFTAADPDAEFTPIAGTEYAYRVESFQDNLIIGDKQLSVAIVEIRTPQRTFKRWVFDDPAHNRDMAMTEGLAQHGADIPLDENIQTVYRPGTRPPAPIMILAGPGESDLAVMVTKATGEPAVHEVKPGDEVQVISGVTLTIDRYEPRTVKITRPHIVPLEQRERDVEGMMLIGLDMPFGGQSSPLWLRYHLFPFKSPDETPRGFYHMPRVITAPDGRQIEVMFSQARMPLPANVVLEEFQVASHIGGFTGQTSSIMDWISHIRFEGEDGWGETKAVRVNKPVEHEGYWFFQAQWDAPSGPRFEGDTGSAGLNYTVLGVGNRNGVNVQLAGCVISVIGMLFTFYVKPIIKRRRQQAVYASVASRSEAGSPPREREPMSAGAHEVEP